jgi:hypothetical protein
VADESKFGQKQGSILKCEDWEALLTDALDGLLPAGETTAFTAHSETCANCGDLLAHAKQGQEWLGYLHTEPEIPAGLFGKILEQTVGAGSVPLPVVAQAGVSGGAMVMPWRRSFHETRLLMTVAMAFFSIALTLNLMGVKAGSFKLADLKPSQIGNTISREYFGAQKQVVQYYDHLRFVYELESRTRELRRDVETQPQQQPGTQQNQQQTKPSGKDGSARSEQGTGLRASEGTGYRVQGADEHSAPSELRTKVQSAEPGVRSLKEQRTDQNETAAEVRVSVGTGRTNSLGQSRTGLQQGQVEGSLV